jgi:hypothetical protein
MTHRVVSTAAIAIALMSLAFVAGVPAWAGHDGIHPTFRAEHAYLTCSFSQGSYAWRIEQPGSALQGNGCQALQPVEPYVAATGCTAARICWPYRSWWGMSFRGEFTGNLRDLTLQIHRLSPIEQIEPLGSRPDVGLRVDGNWIPLEAAESAPTTAGPSDMYQLSIGGLGCAREVLDEDGGVADVVTDGLATEDGPGSHVHDIQILIWGSQFWGPPWEPSVWVWGASEFPSGITANPETELTGDLRVAAKPADCSDETA